MVAMDTRYTNRDLNDFDDEELIIKHFITQFQERKFNQGIEVIREITPETMEWNKS